MEFIDDGCGDFPSGEISIAPIENDSNGDLLVTIGFCFLL